MTIIGDWKAVDDTFLYQIRAGKYDHDDVMRLVEAFEDQEWLEGAEAEHATENEKLQWRVDELKDERDELEGERDELKEQLELTQRDAARLEEVLDEREGEIEELREELRGRMYRRSGRGDDWSGAQGNRE